MRVSAVWGLLGMMTAATAATVRTSAAEAAPKFWRQGWAFTAYAGVLNNPDKADTHNLMAFADYPQLVWQEKLFGLSADKRLGAWRDLLMFEAESTLAFHSGSVDYGEITLLGGFRWLKFPWDRWVDTSLAYHIGVSYASALAAFENNSARADRHTSHWLPTLKMELEIHLPKEQHWSTVLGYHHRSGAWGTFADRGTISDFAYLGLKYRP